MEVCFEDIVFTGVDLDSVEFCKEEIESCDTNVTMLNDSDLIYAIEDVVDARTNSFVWYFLANPLEDYDNRLMILYWFDIYTNTWTAKEFALSIRVKCTELHMYLSRPSLSISLTAPIDPSTTISSISVQDGVCHFEDVCLIAVEDVGDGALAFHVGITN